MRRIHLLFYIFILLIFCHCGSSETPTQRRLNQLLQRMTIPQKIGHMLIIGFDGNILTQEVKQMIAGDFIGGLYLSGFENFSNAQQLTRLTSTAQRLALSSTEIPLFICTNQEGGLFQELASATGGTDTPGNFALSQNRSFEDTYNAYRIMARELWTCGINLNLAPVANLASERADFTLRTFGHDPALVAKLTQAAVRGLQQNRMMAVAKYFPAKFILHNSFQTAIEPTPNHSDQPQLSTFRAAIQEDVSGIMLSSDYLWGMPSDSLNARHRKSISGFLHRDLGFRGLILSEDLNQMMITKNLSPEEIVVQAIQAGVDLIIQKRITRNQLQRQIEAVSRAVAQGKISRQRIERSVYRILQAKMDYHLFEPEFADPNRLKQNVNAPEMYQASLEIARRCIQINDPQQIFPVIGEYYESFFILSPDSSFWLPDSMHIFRAGMTFKDLISRELPEIDFLIFKPFPDDSLCKIALEKAKKADLTILATAIFGDDRPQISLIDSIASLKSTTIGIDLTGAVPDSIKSNFSACITASGLRRSNLQASIDAIFGRIRKIQRFYHESARYIKNEREIKNIALQIN